MQIAIASGKGGTGKTTLSVNLATFLAEKFKGTEQRIVLTDLDVEEPNAGLFLNGALTHKEEQFRRVPEWDEDACTLCKRCARICEFNALAFLGISVVVFPELCHSCYACSELCPDNALPMKYSRMGELKHYLQNENFHFVESRLDIGIEQPTPLIKDTRRYLQSHFDSDWISLIDAPPGTSCSVMEAVKGSDLVVLVTEPTPFGLHDLKLAVETMEELNKTIAVVVNKYGVGDQEVENYCREKNLPVLGRIPHLRTAAEHYSEGKLLWQNLSEIKEAMETIYNGIVQWTTK